MNLKIVVLFLLLNKVGLAQDSPAFSSQTIKRDFDNLYQSIQSTHYNLFAFTSKEKYDSLYQRLKLEIANDSLTLLQTATLYQRLVSFANTGHCEIDFPAQSYIAYAYSGGVVFPLELAFENGRTYIRKNFTSYSQIEVGDQVWAIDGVSIEEILQKMYPLVSAERSYFKETKIEFISFPRLLFQLNGRKESWSIQIKKKANQIVKLEVKAIPVLEYETNRNGELVDPQKRLRLYGDIAYLSPGQFGSNESDGEMVYKKYIDSVFSVISKTGVKSLIIDLRNNPGGHNAYCDYLISYFAHKPFKWYSDFSIRTSQILKEQTRLQADTTDDYSRAILNNNNGRVFKYNFPLYSPVEKARRFIGKVYVLINRHTYSMAAVSAALIQDYKFGKIVGEETGDVPTLYASQFSYKLPLTGIIVKVPKGYIVRVNGSKKLEGVKPDLYIRDHLLDDKDEILDSLMERLRKLKKH